MNTSALPEGACDIVSERGVALELITGVGGLPEFAAGALLLLVPMVSARGGVDGALVKAFAGSNTVRVVDGDCCWVVVMASWPGSEQVRLTATLVPRFNSSIRVASLTSVAVATVVAFPWLMIWAVPFCVDTMATVPGLGDSNASLASNSRRAVNGGAGTTNEPFNNRFFRSLLRLLMIFSSMSARTPTLAVCSGGPVCSFLSHFFVSESFLKYPPCSLMCPFRAGMFLNLRWHRLHSTGFWSTLEIAVDDVVLVAVAEDVDEAALAGVVVMLLLLTTQDVSTVGLMEDGWFGGDWISGAFCTELDALDTVAVVTLF